MEHRGAELPGPREYAMSTPARQHATGNGAALTVPAQASPLQAQMWAVDRLRGGDIGYLTSEVLCIEGELDPDRLRTCLTSLAERHDALLTGFDFDGENLRQISAGSAEPILDACDLSTQDDPAIGFADLVQAVLEQPMPLDRPPLVRWLLATAGPVSHLAVVLHHIVADGWSLEILLNELGALYAGQELPAAPPPYRDYARDLALRMSDGSLDEARAYWRATLESAPATSTIAGIGLRPSYRGDHRLFPVPPRLLRDVSDLAATAGTSPYMVHLTALVLLLVERDGQDDLVVGLPGPTAPTRTTPAPWVRS